MVAESSSSIARPRISEDRLNSASRKVACQIWNLLGEYEERLSVGWDKGRALEAEGRLSEGLYQHWLWVEREYKILWHAYAIEELHYRTGRPPYYKSLEDVLRLLAVE